MKVKIKSFNGVLPEYLTKGKVYDVVKPMDKHGIAEILSDDGFRCHIQLLRESARLNGGSWEVLSEK